MKGGGVSIFPRGDDSWGHYSFYLFFFSVEYVSNRFWFSPFGH